MEGGRKEAQEEGTYVYLWLIHVDVWQKPTQNYKALTLQVKINKILKKEKLVADTIIALPMSPWMLTVNTVKW